MPPSFNYVNGELVPVDDLIFYEDGTASGFIETSVIASSGVNLIVEGLINGSVEVADSANLEVTGVVNGSLSVAKSATVTVVGAINGSMYIAELATVTIAASGQVSGSLDNHGLIVNAGTRAGQVTGPGTINDLPGSTVKLES